MPQGHRQPTALRHGYAVAGPCRYPPAGGFLAHACYVAGPRRYGIAGWRCPRAGFPPAFRDPRHCFAPTSRWRPNCLSPLPLPREACLRRPDLRQADRPAMFGEPPRGEGSDVEGGRNQPLCDTLTRRNGSCAKGTVKNGLRHAGSAAKDRRGPAACRFSPPYGRGGTRNAWPFAQCVRHSNRGKRLRAHG